MDIDNVFKELAEYKILLDETQTMIDGLQDTIKQYMKENNLTVLTGNEHKATYTTVVSNRFDSKALKEVNPGLYAQYTKQTSAPRFTFK